MERVAAHARRRAKRERTRAAVGGELLRGGVVLGGGCARAVVRGAERATASAACARSGAERSAWTARDEQRAPPRCGALPARSALTLWSRVRWSAVCGSKSLRWPEGQPRARRAVGAIDEAASKRARQGRPTGAPLGCACGSGPAETARYYPAARSDIGERRRARLLLATRAAAGKRRRRVVPNAHAQRATHSRWGAGRVP